MWSVNSEGHLSLGVFPLGNPPDLEDKANNEALSRTGGGQAIELCAVDACGLPGL